MFGYGNYDLAIDTLEKALTGRDYIAGDRFTAADLFVGANVNFMLQFNLLEPRPVFTDYAGADDRPRRLSPRQGHRRQADRRDAGAGNRRRQPRMTDDIRQQAIALYDRFTHEGMDRREFMAPDGGACRQRRRRRGADRRDRRLARRRRHRPGRR